MKKLFLLILFLAGFLLFAEAGHTLVCTKDLNGNGQIDANSEKWTCLGTNPPLCPQDLADCSIQIYAVSGSASVAPTAVSGKSGFSRIAAGSGLIDFSGWSCSSSSCSETYGGKISFSEGTVSGSASADKITRITGSGSELQIYGCVGSGCNEALIGSISVSGAAFTGTAFASDGLVSVSANSGSLSFSGTTCSQSGCSTAAAGTITLSGTKATCPYGGQYSCADHNGALKCSQLSCFDETGKGEIGAGQKICSKDLNGDGNIDFTSEVVTCSNIDGTDFCPIGAVNCGIGNIAPICPTNGRDCPGGSFNTTLKRCETAQVVSAYRCPANGSVYGDQASCQSACLQTAACTTPAITGSGAFDMTDELCIITGAGSCLYFDRRGGSSYNRGPVCFPGITFSGTIQLHPPGGTHSSINTLSSISSTAFGANCYWNGSSFSCMNSESITVSGGTISGGGLRDWGCDLGSCIGGTLPNGNAWSNGATPIYAGWASGNTLVLGTTGGETTTLSFTAARTCPLGNYPCNGGACSSGQACSAEMGCPSNYYKVNSTCIAQPQGGAAIAIDSTTHLCEAQATNSCPGAGFGYDATSDQCVKNVDCGTGTLDGGLDLCIYPVSDKCPSGFAYSTVYGACLEDASCHNGGTLNPWRDSCEIASTPTCSNNYVLNAASNQCLSDPTCQLGTFTASLGKCVLSASSFTPTGYVYNAALDRFELVPPPCPAGSIYSSSADLCTLTPNYDCVPPGSYNAGTGKCETSTAPVCTAGGMTYDAIAGLCYASSTCPGTGATLNSATELCEIAFTPACPGSYTWNSARLKCELTPQCSSGSYNASRDRCESAATGMSCPSGYTWNASAGKCQLGPACAGGSYNSSTDRCELAATPHYYCSYGGDYGSLGTCQAYCYQSAACYYPTVSGSGSFSLAELCMVYGSGSCLYFQTRYGETSGPVCFSGLTFSSGIQLSPPGGTHGGVAGLAARSPSYFEGGLGWYGVFSTGLPGAVYVTGGTVSGGGLIPFEGMPVPAGYTAVSGIEPITYGYASGNVLVAATDRGEVSYLTFNSTTLTCPLGGYGCSGGYCYQPGSCPGPYYSCPGGWSLSGSTCYQAASCTAGGNLNGAADKCEAPGSPSCSTGTYDSGNGICYTSAACPDSGSLNSSLDKCQVNATNSCQGGYTINAGLGICTATPQCVAGAFNSTRDRCEQASIIGCPSAGYYALNPSGNLCEATPGHSCSLNGFLYNSSMTLCTNAVACPSGGTLSGTSDMCVIQMTSALCPSGFTYDTATDDCLKDPDPCIAGTYNAGIRKCVQDVTPSCPGGYTYSIAASVCQMPPGCENTSAYDGALDKCKIPGASLCPAQYTFDFANSQCQENPRCDSGSSYSSTLDLCAESPTRQCPTSDYMYQASIRQCTAAPLCFAGNFDPATNMCIGANANCPLGLQYACLTNPTTGALQCSASTCFTITNQPTTKTTADVRSYQNDGTLDSNTGICQGQPFIFNGKGRECRPSGVSTSFFNCCNTDPGSLWFIQNACGSEEMMTVKGLAAGNCHYVGDYCKEKWPFIGCVQKANIYCCFGSKLSRIIHEQGRAQLRAFNGWGGAENPDCRGFSPEEFSMLDFTKIDLSEYFSEIQNKAQSAIQQNMQQKTNEYYEKLR